MEINKRFSNLSKCLADLSASGAAHLTDNTLPATLAAIAEFESHPETDEVNGIDLKRLYKYLANLMAGHPTEELEEGPTKQFLYKCYGVWWIYLTLLISFRNSIFGNFFLSEFNGAHHAYSD